MTYDLWFESYMSLYKRGLRPKTRESYLRIHALLSPLIGQIGLTDITPDDIQRALLAVEDASGSRQAQIAYAQLHAIFRRAVRSRHIELSPVDAVDKPSHEAAKARAITGSDWDALLPALLGSPALALMAFAGLRRGEVLGLRRGDIDFAAGLIHVERQRLRVAGRMTTCPPKSSAGVRCVPIVPELLPILRDATRCMLPSAPVVSCAPETLQRRWKRAQELVAIREPYRLHDLRHTYVTRLVMAGVLPRVVQYVAGHSSLGLTMDVYAHIGPREAVSEFSRLKIKLH